MTPDRFYKFKLRQNPDHILLEYLSPSRRAQGQKSPRGSTRIVVFQLRGYPWPVNPNQGEFANADPSAL